MLTDINYDTVTKPNRIIDNYLFGFNFDVKCQGITIWTMHCSKIRINLRIYRCSLRLEVDFPSSIIHSK